MGRSRDRLAEALAMAIADGADAALDWSVILSCAHDGRECRVLHALMCISFVGRRFAATETGRAHASRIDPIPQR